MDIPKNEILCVWFNDKDDNPRNVITSTKNRETYKLYKVVDNDLVYTKHKAKDPRDLERWVFNNEDD